MLETIRNIIQSFEHTTLEKMNDVRLQDRKDAKYVLAVKRIPELLHALQAHYIVLEIQSKRLMQYKTLYYDTPDFQLYTDHHNGKLNRYKYRSRTYVETGSSFFEVKFKNNKGRTIKNRAERDTIEESLTHDSRDFITEISGSHYTEKELEAKLWVYYKRITLVDKELTERVTIDLELSFEGNERSSKMSDIAIIELKQDKSSKSSVITSLLKNEKITTFGFSKYCMGIASVYDQVKKNRFKQKFRQLDKLIEK